MYFPSGAQTGVLSVGVRFSSFSWHISRSLLDPLLANHLGSQDRQHEYISLHALNPLCPGLKPATAPLALAEVCVIRLTGPAIHCHDNSSRQALPWTQPSILGLSAAANPKSRTCFCSGQATCILIY